MGLKQLLQDLLGMRPQRIQVAALCVRGSGAARQVLLVTSRGSGRWILPKGWPAGGLGLAAAALREAWEEAGVRGRVRPRPLGSYRDVKGLAPGFGRQVEVLVYEVEVEDVASAFPEAGQRQLRWLSPPDAAAMVEEEGLAALLRQMAPG